MALASTKKKLRILIVAPSFDILGGQAVQAARLLERLQQEPEIEAGFLAVNPRLPGVLRSLQGIKYVRTVVTSIAYIGSLLARVPKFDVIHIFSASYFSFLLAPTPAILISKLFRRKTLLNYHSGEAEDHLQRWRRTAIPTLRLADEIAVPSDYLVEVFARFELVAKPVYNLIDTSTFCFRERSTLRSVFLSNRNFEKHYGVDRVLRAFAIIQERIPQARLIIAGDGPERSALENLARDLTLQHTEFTGRVSHERVVELYDSADIFLNASEIDNQPLSLLEAFACGLAVITTDAGGIPYMVTPERTALVVPRGDYRQLAECAFRLLDDSALAQRLIEQARAECRKYEWASVGQQWLNIYGGLAGKSMLATDTNDSQTHAKLEENQRPAL